MAAKASPDRYPRVLTLRLRSRSRRRFPDKRLNDLKKRKRAEPIAHVALFIRDIWFLSSRKKSEETDEDDVKELENKFLDWRSYVAEKMDGIELNLEGVKYNLSVEIPASDDFKRTKRDWEESYALESRSYSRGGRQEPDTVVLRGVPSRWFAEPRVSSKPSMLVTHTIFSKIWMIRNLIVAEDNDLAKLMDEDDLDVGIVLGLHCKIIVQFEKFRDFYNALKVLCGRSLQKQGSRLSADYEVAWDKDGFFQNSRSQSKSLLEPQNSRTCGRSIQI